MLGVGLMAESSPIQTQLCLHWTSGDQYADCPGCVAADPTIVAKHVGPHACRLPGWLERRRRGIRLGDIVECNGCHQRWEWRDIGWFDCQKIWWRL